MTEFITDDFDQIHYLRFHSSDTHSFNVSKDSTELQQTRLERPNISHIICLIYCRLKISFKIDTQTTQDRSVLTDKKAKLGIDTNFVDPFVCN